MTAVLLDTFGRTATDMRVSLTDRCNLRCTYCMPAEGLPWLPSDELLTDDELVRLVRVAADATHQMLLGKDSPQVATKLAQTATTSRWSVASGGRMGGVLGEDSIELSAGATNCTSDCQARNRIQGSVPVPPDPTSPTPIG